MINITKIILFYHTIKLFGIVSLSPIPEFPDSDIIVDINKGFALRRLGEYSPNVVEQIAHSFISLDNLCITLPNTDACIYNTHSKKMNMFELATVMASHDVVQTFSSYNKESVSKLISNDIIQILTQHQPDQIINNTKSMIHFMNDRFYYPLDDEKANTSLDDNNIIDTYSPVPRLRSSAADTIIQRISSHKIDFDYLSSSDLKVFLSAIFATFHSLYRSESDQNKLNIFSQLIVGQSVYGLPYCSLTQNNPLLFNPCLIISTLFLQIPQNAVSKFSVFRLIPLTITFNHNKYHYFNMPNIIGINHVDQTLVTWDDELDINQCIFSPIVTCRSKPVSMSLAKVSCLSQLLDNHQISSNLCEVKRSNNIQNDVFHVADRLWLFHNINQTIHCQIYSSMNRLPETITINEASIVNMPCDKTMICPDFQLPIEVCRANRISILPSFDLNVHDVSRFVQPIKNMTNIILSSYRTEKDHFVKDMINAIKTQKSILDSAIENPVIYSLSSITFILIIILSFCVKLNKHKSDKGMDNIHSQIYDIINI